MTIELVLKTSAVLVSAVIATSMLRRAASATRHLVWSMAIISVLLAPLIIRLAPRVPVLPGVPEVPKVWFQADYSEVPEVPRVPGIEHSEPFGTQPNEAVGTIGTFGTLGTLVVLSWFLVCWLLSGLSVWRGSRPAPESWINEARAIAARVGLQQPVNVRHMTRDGSPHVAGLLRSVVMLPPSASSWTIDARHAALVHELTHIRRRDRLMLAFSQLACAIYWFNPLVWRAAAALARERERACDDEVLRLGAKPSDYAALLLDLAKSATRSWTPATALSMARPSAMEGRLISILADVARTPHRSTRWLVGVALVALTTAILGAQVATPSAPPKAVRPAPLVPPAPLMALDDQAPVPSVTRALIDALKDNNRQVREQAAMGLAITPGADVIDPLLRALRDSDAQVREKAAIGLAFRRDPKVVDPLLVAIDDSDAQVRENAAIALGASGDRRAIDALTKAASDPDAQVREKAVAGLVLLGLRQ